MKPPRFQYHAPGSIPEALDHLAAYGGEARLLSGGQSLIPMLNFRLVEPRALIDLARIPHLAGIRDGDPVVIGAMTRQRALEDSPIIARRAPLMREALRWVGHLPTRSRGTIGGSIAHADPAAELPLILVTCGGSVRVEGHAGSRMIAADALFESMFTTRIAADEILTEVHLPAAAPGSRHGFDEYARRHGDFAIVAVAISIEPTGSGSLRVRLGASGVGQVPQRLPAAEAILEDTGLSADSIALAATRAAESVDPIGDANGSADFRRHILKTLLERTLTRTAATA
jgi:carbon-monoxide dehydrogenase medium subunit